MSASKSSSLGVYLRALREVRAYWPHLGAILFIGLLGTPIALLAPLPLKIIVDSVFGSEPLPRILDAVLPAAATASPEAIFRTTVALAVAIALLVLLHRLGDWLLREYVAERMVLEFRGKMFLHSLQLSLQRHDAKGTQDPVYRIHHDAPALQWTALYGGIPLIIAAVSLTGMLYVTAAMNLRLALVALATSVPLILLIHFKQKRLRDRWHDVTERESSAHAVVPEALGALRVVATFGQERREHARFLDRSRTSLRARISAIRMEGAMGLALGLSTALGTTLILYLGARDVQAQVLSVGELLLIMAYIAELYGPLTAVGTHITGQQRAIASAERAFAVLDEQPAVTERPDARPVERAAGDIAFRDVGFAYEDGKPILSGVSLEVPAGSCVGIVGRTGSGKTTLANLLARMIDPTEGRILLDGVDLRDYRLADLRNQFAVVSQEPVLFSTSIAENIAYAKPDASMEEIVAAARLARAHDFIVGLPAGYLTEVGERGMRLSGGERQRIALARAFLKDAPVLILDEPTSAIDVQTESAIVESLERLMQGRTTFMIAHRLSTLRNADIVLRVENGTAVPEPHRQPEEWLKAS